MIFEIETKRFRFANKGSTKRFRQATPEMKKKKKSNSTEKTQLTEANKKTNAKAYVPPLNNREDYTPK